MTLSARVGMAGPLRLSWTAPPATPRITVPPVAGYAVEVDGESIVIPAPRAGAHTIAVPTLNAVDRYSAPAGITIGSARAR